MVWILIVASVVLVVVFALCSAYYLDTRDLVRQFERLERELREGRSDERSPPDYVSEKR